MDNTTSYLKVEIPEHLNPVIDGGTDIIEQIIETGYTKSLKHFVTTAIFNTDSVTANELIALKNANPNGGFSTPTEEIGNEIGDKFIFISGLEELSEKALKALMDIDGFSLIYSLNNYKKLESEIVTEHFTPILKELAELQGLHLPDDIIKNGSKKTLRHTFKGDNEGTSARYDTSIFTIIIQHGSDAILTQIDDEWYIFNLKPNEALIQVGFIAYLMSNGRLMPMYYKIRAVTQIRTVSIYSASLPDDTEITVPLEIINGELSDATFMGIVRKEGIKRPDGSYKVTIGALNKG